MDSALATPAPLDEVDGDRLIGHVQAIAAVDRESGTPGEWESARYVLSYLHDHGIEARMQTITTITSRPLSASLRLGSDADLTCITQSYSGSATAMSAPLVRVDDPLTSGADYTGRIVVTFGLASPSACRVITDQGATGIIFINDDEYPHNMAISSVWGMPTREQISELDYPPVVSLARGEGDRLLEYLATATAPVATISTTVDTGLRELPLVIADIHSTTCSTDRFVLLNGHLDSWHRGAIDNATGNAVMLEIARIAHQHRDQLRTNLRVVFWSGHSDGRYSGSDWYADHAWMDLHDHCVLNVNIDSVGAKGATDYPRVYASAHCYQAGLAAVNVLTGHNPSYARIERNGDQSFWNHGVPSLFQVLSLFPQDSAGGSTFVPGLPWHWHTTQDLAQEAGEREIAQDCQIYLAALWDFCASSAYPFVFADIADEMHDYLTGAGARTGGQLAALDQVIAAAEDFRAAARAFDQLLARARQGEAGSELTESVNLTAMELNRLILPVTNCSTGPFRTDGALPQGMFPGLVDLDALIDQGDPLIRAAHERELVRESNRIIWMLRSSERRIARCLSEVSA